MAREAVHALVGSLAVLLVVLAIGPLDGVDQTEPVDDRLNRLKRPHAKFIRRDYEL